MARHKRQAGNDFTGEFGRNFHAAPIYMRVREIKQGREEVSERGKDQVARSLNTSGRASPRDVFKQINSEPT